MSLALTFLTILAPLTQAGCSTWSTSVPTVTADDLYIVNDLCQPNCILSTWVYQESNHIAGLQRHDAVVDDTCGGLVDGDRIIV